MSKARRRRELRDVYRFPGFVPGARVRGVFGDRTAVVVSLARREKKRRAASVVAGIGATTINVFDASEICRAATSGCTWRWSFGGSSAGAAPR